MGPPVLLPSRIQRPVPTFTRSPVPVTVPRNVVLALLPPASRFAAPSATVPSPAIEPMLSVLAAELPFGSAPPAFTTPPMDRVDPAEPTYVALPPSAPPANCTRLAFTIAAFPPV